MLPAYPGIKVEIFIQHSFADIAAERFDAGVRLGESLEKDMIAVRIARTTEAVAGVPLALKIRADISK